MQDVGIDKDKLKRRSIEAEQLFLSAVKNSIIEKRNSLALEIQSDSNNNQNVNQNNNNESGNGTPKRVGGIM
jgi:hypothetical protein